MSKELSTNIEREGKSLHKLCSPKKQRHTFSVRIPLSLPLGEQWKVQMLRVPPRAFVQLRKCYRGSSVLVKWFSLQVFHGQAGSSLQPRKLKGKHFIQTSFVTGVFSEGDAVLLPSPNKTPFLKKYIIYTIYSLVLCFRQTQCTKSEKLAC